jgi:hypothetical protein
VGAIVLEITASNATAPGTLSLYSDDVAAPATTDISFPITNSSTDFAIVAVGTDGGIDITSNTGNPDVALTVEGYFTADGSQAGAGGYKPVTEARILDRTASPIQPGQTIQLQIGGSNGVPTGANAIFANLTATSGSGGSGGITIWPVEQQQPVISTMRWNSGVSSSGATIDLQSSGTVNINNSGNQAIGLTADLDGYFSGGSASSGSPFIPVEARLFDSSASGSQPVAAGQTQTIQVANTTEDLPDTPFLKAVILNASVSGPVASGTLTVYPSGTTRPTAMTMAYDTGANASALTLVPVGADGTVSVYNGSAAPIVLTVDAEGWFADTSSQALIDSTSEVNVEQQATLDLATGIVTNGDATGSTSTTGANGSLNASGSFTPLAYDAQVDQQDSNGSCYKKSGTNNHLTVYQPRAIYREGNSYEIRYFYAFWSIAYSRQLAGVGYTWQLEGCTRGGGSVWNGYRQTFDGSLMTLQAVNNREIGDAWPTHVSSGGQLVSSLAFKVDAGPVTIGANINLSGHDSYNGNTGANPHYCVDQPHCISSDWNINRVNTYYTAPTTYRWNGTSSYQGNDGHGLWEYPQNYDHSSITWWMESNLYAHCQNWDGIGCGAWN